jgi:hypothetical protein
MRKRARSTAYESRSFDRDSSLRKLKWWELQSCGQIAQESDE